MTSQNPNAVGFGGMLGFVNTLFIAIGVCTYTHEGVGIGVVVFMFGIIPGLITGMALGAFANATAQLAVWMRRLMLCLPAIGVLLGIAEFFTVGELFLPAVIPTIVCALILERRTRYVAPVPAATIH
jgi:ABC-type dipeptide/oligopeptide/nickel transport system permease subunit